MPAIQALNGMMLANQSIPIQLGTNAVPSSGSVQIDNFGQVSPEETWKFQSKLDGNVVFSDAGDFLRAQQNELTPKQAVTNSIQRIQDQFAEIEAHLTELTNKGQDLATEDLIMLQYDLLQLNYVCEMSTKTADKTSNAAQTLFRNQG